MRVGNNESRFVFENNSPSEQVSDLLDGVLDFIPVLIGFKCVPYELFRSLRTGEFDFLGELFCFKPGGISGIRAYSGDLERDDEG